MAISVRRSLFQEHGELSWIADGPVGKGASVVTCGEALFCTMLSEHVDREVYHGGYSRTDLRKFQAANAATSDPSFPGRRKRRKPEARESLIEEATSFLVELSGLLSQVVGRKDIDCGTRT